MAGDVTVGDAERPSKLVQPADETTVVTLSVLKPDGSSEAVPLTAEPLEPAEDGTGEQQQRWTATDPVLYDQPARWLLRWTISGEGADYDVQTVYVVPNPLANGPTWLPGRSRVANYVPARTLQRDSNTHQLTFDSTTVPTGAMVDRLIADGAARIASRTGPIHSSLHDAASVVVALWAAAAVERGWPDDQQTELTLQRANDLLRLADTQLDELVAANDAANGGNPVDPGQANALLPRWSFPPPVPWGDSYL
ncbi:hypothetical protein [Polymorphospora lycopeni]|uniref:Uncharacterized protein n=1 Tax=Polymorphospora lycopeni TaxID=3140240 RepID=A0ABV5CKU9_9ACTN